MSNNRTSVAIGDRTVGDGLRVFIVAEIGINHNGDYKKALRLIDIARDANCDAVKFQIRTPELCVPPHLIGTKKIGSPWGEIDYLEYRRRLELPEEAYQHISAYCRGVGITWFASVWDSESLVRYMDLAPACVKIPSARVSDTILIGEITSYGVPVILSTGMSHMHEVETAVERLKDTPLVLLHNTSTYPCPHVDLNLRVICTLRQRFPHIPVGYSGHEVDLVPSVLAAAAGACMIERHITEDKDDPGSDQSISLDREELRQLVSSIRSAEICLGSSAKRFLPSEVLASEKLQMPKSSAHGRDG